MSNKHITSAISQYFGKFAAREFAPWFQKIVNQSYVSLMGLDMREFKAASTYKSLDALFTRHLRENRHFSLDGSDFISPCDSLITECGNLVDDYALQIKGMRYSSDELLGDNFSKEDKAKLHNGQFINFYLSPKDYHRYHVPMNLKILKAVHIPGKLYPVNMPSLRKRLNLFIENERVVIQCETHEKKVLYIVLVGALNVGVMDVSFEPRIKTNSDAVNQSVYEYEDLYLNKGDDLGCFHMGSTIVVFSEENMFEIFVNVGEKVSYAQTIAKYLG